MIAFVFTFVAVENAHAVVFMGTTFGEWDNVVSSNASDLYWINNGDTGDVASLNWGIPSTTLFNNKFTFDGIGSDGDPAWTVNSEEAFLIGNFDYRNGSTINSSGMDGVDLIITMALTSPLAMTDSYDFNFSMTNTPNTTGDPVLDGDIVTVASSFSNTIFNYDSVDYTLELLGFSSDGGTTIRTDFSSPEGATASAGLYARITSEIPPPSTVPEPATMVLMGTGLLGMALRKRFA